MMLPVSSCILVGEGTNGRSWCRCAPPSLLQPAAYLWKDEQVRLELAGVGLSVVTGARERLYSRVSGIRLRATGSQARRTLELALHSVQVNL